jgi:hypothetical protein
VEAGQAVDLTGGPAPGGMVLSGYLIDV